jgi:hypothetical protein
MEAISSAIYLIRDWWSDKSNRVVVVVLLLGLPLFVEVFRDKFWAYPALQVYLCSASVGWFLWSVREFSWRSHPLVAVLLVTAIHALLMTGLVVMNYASPQINKAPRILYGFLAGLMTLEVWVSSKILGKFLKQEAIVGEQEETQNAN